MKILLPQDARWATERGAPRRFDTVTIALHWTTVALILGMFASAWLKELVSNHEQASLILTLHRSLGVTTFVIAVCRFGWRLGFSFLPPFPPTMPKGQQRLAQLNEYGLYAFLLMQPLTGLAQSLTRGRPFPLFGWDVPPIMARDEVLHAVFHKIHAVSAFALLGLVVAHILAALFHRLVLRDEVFQSMLPMTPSNKDVAAKTITIDI